MMEYHECEKFEIINLTPHPINLKGFGEIKPSGYVARLPDTIRKEIITYMKTATGEGELKMNQVCPAEQPVGMPPKWQDKPCVLYIVSRMVAEKIRLPNVVCPDEYIRDAKGNIIGANAVAWIAPAIICEPFIPQEGPHPDEVKWED